MRLSEGIEEVGDFRKGGEDGGDARFLITCLCYQIGLLIRLQMDSSVTQLCLLLDPCAAGPKFNARSWENYGGGKGGVIKELGE